MEIMRKITFTLCMLLGFSASSTLPMRGGYNYNHRQCNTCWEQVQQNEFPLIRCCYDNATCNECLRANIEGAIAR